jgi:hypothetical protein
MLLIKFNERPWPPGGLKMRIEKLTQKKRLLFISRSMMAVATLLATLANIIAITEDGDRRKMQDTRIDEWFPSNAYDDTYERKN